MAFVDSVCENSPFSQWGSLKGGSNIDVAFVYLVDSI